MIIDHKFTDAGLGKAPFSYIGMTENAFPLHGGYSKAGGTCDYCGTGIRWEHHIRSADGKVSRVGCDCIRKIGDGVLMSAADKAEKDRKRQERADKRKAEIMARLQVERDNNGGLTNYELAEKRREEERAAELLAKAPTIAALAPYVDLLADGNGGFRDSVADDLRRGELPSGRGFLIMLDILAKNKGRANSKAYVTERDRLEEFFNGLAA